VRFDFWNNPLVVTAMRLKYRRGSPGVWAALWVLALLGVGALLHYISQTETFRFPTTYLVAILGLQCIISAVIAVISTSSSMNAEVVNRTLDFQRIVTLSPRAILLGKMIGEPALSYFLMIASMPLAALCWGFGAASGSVILWLYVNLTTFTLMWAAMGLINSLTPPTQAAGRSKSGGGAGVVIMFAVVPQLLIHGRNSLDTPGIGDVVQMLTPIGSLVHLWKDNAWNSSVSFWGLSLPSLLLAPVLQLSVAAWIVAAMSRRLKNALDPLASKRCSYYTLAVVDLAIAGICYAQWLRGYDATKLVYGYGLAHIVVSLIMTFAAVPRRPAILAWIWRRESPNPRLSELLSVDRAEMSLAAIVYGVIGSAVLVIGLVGPMALTATPARVMIPPKDLAEITLATFMIVVALTLLQQLLVASTSRGGSLMFILFIILANLLPPICAAALRASSTPVSEEFTESIAALSPVALFVSNMQRVGSPNVGARPLIIVYGAMAVICFALLRRALRREGDTVGGKLQAMAVI
jgi:hypothetical protein